MKLTSRFIVACASLALAPVSQASLLAYYPFDSNIQDASGNLNHGTLVDVGSSGNTVITTDAMFGGGAMDFSDDRDYVSIPAKVFADGATYTIAFWAKRDSSVRQYDVVAGDVTDPDNFLTFFNNNILRFEGEAGNGSRVDLAHNVTTTDWVHYAYVADGTHINLYANGVLLGRQDVNTSLHLNAIGAGYVASLESDFQGKIDELYLFDEALSLAEITELKNNNTPPAAPTPAANPMDLGKLAVLGDSITQAAIGRQGYRYTLWKHLVEAGHSFELVGSHDHNFNSANVNDTASISNYPTIAGTVFDSDNEGHWGWKTTDVLGTTTPSRTPGTGTGTLADWLNAYTPDTVFILLGVNDIRNSTGATVAATAANMQTIINDIKTDNPNVTIYLGSVLPASSSFVSAQKVTDLNVAYQNIAANDDSVTYIDVAQNFNSPAHTYDGVHPNPIGEKIVGNALYAAILSQTPVAISVSNHDFEDANLSDGGISGATPPSWTSNHTGDLSFNPQTSTRYYNEPEFGDSHASGGAAGTMDGPTFGGFFATGNAAILSQTLGTNLQADTSYTLRVSLGHRTIDSGAAATASDVTIELRAGGVVIATATASPSAGDWLAADDVWADVVATGAVTASHPQIGQALEIRIIKAAAGDYMDADNVRLEAIPTTPQMVDLEDGLVSYHDFEADFTNSSAASAGNATPVNTPLAAVLGGQVGKAVALKGGNNDHIQLATSFGPGATTLGESFTVSAWYRANDPIISTNTSGRYFVFEGSDSFDVSFGLRSDLGGTAGVNDGQIYTDGSASPNRTDLADAALPGWHHVLQTYSASGGTTTITTYIDGVAVSTLSPSTASVSGSGLNFGAPRSSTTNRGFDGMLDEVAVWSRALNGSEIAAVFDAGNNGQSLVNDDPAPTAPTINSFTVSDDKITAGSSTDLSWNVSGATTVSIDESVGAVAATGTTSVTPTNPVIYTLTADNGTAVTRAQVMVLHTLGKIRVFLLGGQSNMQGVGRKSKLVPLGLDEIPEVLLYHSTDTSSTGGANQLITVRANGFNSSSFGPEIGIADTLRQLCPGDQICLIKHAAGGTSLQVKWNPGADNNDTGNFGVEYTQFVNTVNGGLAALRSAGYEPEIEGMFWQQGEQDCKEGLNTGGDGNATSADDYGANLKHFVGRVREQFASDIASTGMRFVLGQVAPYYPAGGSLETAYPGRDKVRLHQLNADENSGAALTITNTATVPTNDTEFLVHEQEMDGYRDTDEAHLIGEAQLLLGERMVHKLLKLAPQTYADWSTGHTLTGGKDDDDDNDGLSNFYEYVTGTNPKDATSNVRATHSYITVGGDDFLQISLRRSLNTMAVSYTPQYSEDLENWNTLGTPVLVKTTHHGDGTATLEYRAPFAANTNPKMFLRFEMSE